MPADDSFPDLMIRLNQGDQGAAARVFQRFTNRLVGLARLHLDSRVRQKVDPEDVLQSVYRSFFVRQAQGEFTFEGWEGLWALLAVLTVRKCGRVTRYYHTDGRNIAAEIAPRTGDADALPWEGMDKGPMPSEVVMLTDLVERLLVSLDTRDRTIVSLALQGYSAAEIVQETRTPQRTVYRVLEHVKTWLHAQDTPG